MPLEDQPPEDASADLESRFALLVRENRGGEAAELLQQHYAGALCKKLAKLALALGGGDEAEHLTHWTIALAVTNGARFDPQRGRLATWLFFLARNLGRSQLRKLRADVALPAALAADARSVESRIHNRDAFLRVWRRIGSEPLRQVLFLDLKHHGQAPGALARELGIDRDTLYKRRCEARRVFREIWTQEFGDPAGSFYGELE